MGRRVMGAFVVFVVVALGGGCSDDEDAGGGSKVAGGSSSAESSTTSTRPPVSRPDGPSADLSEEITVAGVPFMGAAAGSELPAGYEEHEYVASGEATAYSGPNPPTTDGRWSFEPTTTAPYRTRIVIRRPTDSARFSGTVVVEWLNVSGGLDANPDYASMSEEIARQGHAWIGVSAQLVGVAGGPVLVAAPGAEALVGKGLVGLVPDRYGSLSHPGDGYSFDIFTQVATAVRGGADLFGGKAPEVVLAVGESQSAIALTTYYNGVQPLTVAFDGFLIHSRAFVSLPMVAADQAADLSGAMTVSPAPVLLRDDLDAPVLELQSEGDVIGVLNSAAVRQDDTDTFRLWEVAGTSHADRHLLGALADQLDCGVEINDGPLHVVAKAALRALVEWVRTGEPPPVAPRLELTDDTPPAMRRDEDGIALGGIRTPPVDAPTQVLSGQAGPSSDLMCLLMGSTLPLSVDRRAELYPTPADYERKFAAALDSVIDAGFVLEEDRAAMEAYSQP